MPFFKKKKKVPKIYILILVLDVEIYLCPCQWPSSTFRSQRTSLSPHISLRAFCKCRLLDQLLVLKHDLKDYANAHVSEFRILGDSSLFYSVRHRILVMAVCNMKCPYGDYIEIYS